MEIKATLLKPYTADDRFNFIANNTRLGYQFEETKTALEAWGYTQEEQEEQEAERIAHLHLTRGDVFRGLLQAKGITRAQIRAMIEQMPDTTPAEQLAKEMALIDFDEALEFYRGVPLINTLGTALGITSQQMTKFFKTNDWRELNAD